MFLLVENPCETITRVTSLWRRKPSHPNWTELCKMSCMSRTYVVVSKGTVMQISHNPPGMCCRGRTTYITHLRVVGELVPLNTYVSYGKDSLWLCLFACVNTYNMLQGTEHVFKYQVVFYNVKVLLIICIEYYLKSFK